MRRIFTRAKAIEYTLLMILVAAIITIYPLRLWHENIETKGNEIVAGGIDVGGDNVALQQFTTEYDHLDSISFYLGGEYSSDEMCIRIFDENFALQREIKLNTDKFDGYTDQSFVKIKVNLDVEVGKIYYYTIEGLTTNFKIGIEETAGSTMPNHGYMQNGGMSTEEYNLISRYDYKQPLRKGSSLAIIFALILCGVLIHFLSQFLEKKKSYFAELCSIQWAFKLIFNQLIFIMAIIALICILPLHMFSIYIADLIVLSIGVLLLTFILLYVVNRDYSFTDFDLIDYLKDNWQNLAQSLFIALALLATINYMNGLFEIHHDIAWRKMVFFIGLSLIVTFKRKEFFNIYNIALIVGGIITSRIYYVKNFPDMIDEFHVEAMKMTCFCIPVIFVMVGYILRMLVLSVMSALHKASEDYEVDLKRIGSGISIPYTILTLAMMVAMLVRRNTRTWPVIMAVAFGCVAFRVLFWEKRRFFINNIANGVMLHFFGSMIYCLWHRPYEAYTYARYPFVFHTVTETACYMALVLSVALVKLLYKYNKTRKLKCCVGEFLMFGAVTSYLLFTMSRTGMIAVVGTGLVCWIAMISADRGVKAKFKYLLNSALIIVASMIICFPICFSLQKTIPGLVGEPKLMMIEVYPQTVLVSDDLENEDFISFGRFTQVFLYKMINLPERATNINAHTIYGYVEESKDMTLFDDEGNIIGDIGHELDSDSVMVYAGGKASNFVPPKEYPFEGEAPDEWYDEDFWYFNTETNEWMFASWMYEAESEEEEADVSNGRMDIYKSYLEQMTPEGHEGMGAILNDGSEAAHAHDIYLQVAFDHGIIVGVLFVLWVAMTCIQALIVFMRRRKFDSAAGIVLAVSVTYALAGITEWISHPCNPVGCVILLVIIPLALMGREKADR